MRAAFANAQARVQARHAELVAAPSWQFLQGVGDYEAFLERARGTALRRWIRPIGPQTGHHEIEASLRGQLRGYLREVASWMPGPWQPAVLWLLLLVDLPAIYHLVRGEAALPWMSQDPEIKPYAVEDAGARQRMLRESPWGPLVQRWEGGQSPRGAWVELWQAQWPDSPRGCRGPLLGLYFTIERHLEGLGELPPGQPAWKAWEALQGRMARYFRRQGGQPAAVFAHLALVALELERLRAELVTRALYGRGARAGAP
jgi:hypothetical protein